MADDDAEARLCAMTSTGSVGLAAAFLRASIEDNHRALYDLACGLDDDDNLVSLVLDLTRLAGVGLVKAEGSVEQAHSVVDSLAALGRWEDRQR